MVRLYKRLPANSSMQQMVYSVVTDKKVLNYYIKNERKNVSNTYQ
jgi:hypothetical protein